MLPRLAATVIDLQPDPARQAGRRTLTLWGDQGDAEILCDYGAAYTMMEYLHGQFGTGFMTCLHREDAIGLAGLDVVLDQPVPGVTRRTSSTTGQPWSPSTAYSTSRNLQGGRKSQYQTPTLDATIDWDNAHALPTPGAPPNGSDYVRLRDAAGNPSGSRVSAR